MKITIPDDYVGAARQLPSFSKVAAHEVEIWSDIVRDPAILATRLKDTEAVVALYSRAHQDYRAGTLGRAEAANADDQRALPARGCRSLHAARRACMRKVIPGSRAAPPS